MKTPTEWLARYRTGSWDILTFSDGGGREDSTQETQEGQSLKQKENQQSRIPEAKFLKKKKTNNNFSRIKEWSAWVKWFWKGEKDENGVLAIGFHWLLLTLTADGLAEWQGWKPENVEGVGRLETSNKDIFPNNSARKKWGGKQRGEERVQGEITFLSRKTVHAMVMGLIQCSSWISTEQWGSSLASCRWIRGGRETYCGAQWSSLSLSKNFSQERRNNGINRITKYLD